MQIFKKQHSAKLRLLIKVCVLLFALLGLSACFSTAPSPNTYYYVLDPKPVLIANKTSTKTMQINPIQLPDYLKQPNLVVKLSDHQINITHYHYWAEDLRSSMQQTIINELNLRARDTQFSQRCSNCASITINVHHFYPTQQGNVVLSGVYHIQSANAQVTQQYGFNFSSNLQKGGFDESVAHMRKLLGQLAINIEQGLNRQ